MLIIKPTQICLASHIISMTLFELLFKYMERCCHSMTQTQKHRSVSASFQHLHKIVRKIAVMCSCLQSHLHLTNQSLCACTSLIIMCCPKLAAELLSIAALFSLPPASYLSTELPRSPAFCYLSYMFHFPVVSIIKACGSLSNPHIFLSRNI